MFRIGTPKPKLNLVPIEVRRIQHKRGHKLPPNTKLVARPSRWGNPYKVGEHFDSLGEVLFAYEIWLDNKIHKDSTFLDPLRGFNLACYCPLDQYCHVDILLERLSSG